MRMRRWSVALAIGLIASLLATPVTGHEEPGGEEVGGNNLSTPVIFAEGFGLSGFALSATDITSTGLPGLLKTACDGAEHFSGDGEKVMFPTAGDLVQLQIGENVFAELEAAATADPGWYHLQPYELTSLEGVSEGEKVSFGTDTCWEADWLDGTTLTAPVEVTMVDVGDSLVRVARVARTNPIRVEFVMYQTGAAGIFQDDTVLAGYPMTQIWPPAHADGKPSSVGDGKRMEVWGIANQSGPTMEKAPAEEATVFSDHARLMVHALTWDVIPDDVSDGDLTGYPTGVIPDTFDPSFAQWIESVDFDGTVGGEGEGGFGAEVNQGGKVIFGYNWGVSTGVDEGWYRVTFSLDDGANADLLGVNPADQLADESDGGSDAGLKGFFPPTFVDDQHGTYVYVDVYVAPESTGGGGGGGGGGQGPNGISGHVTTTGGTALEGIEVTVYDGAAPVGVAITGSNGSFDLGLPPGTYEVGFNDPKGNHRSEFFDNRGSRNDADPVVVTGGETTVIHAALATVTTPPGGGGGVTPPTQVLGLQIPFSDVDASHAFYAEIMWMYQRGITKGCEDGKFCPEQSVLRSQIAAMFTRALQLGTAPGSDPFNDDNGWALEAEINFAYQAGITFGCEQGKFCPGHEVTRAQIASMFVRALGLTEGADVNAFSDDDGWSHEADINRLAYAGITLGCEEGKFCPGDNATRAQIAAMFHRALGQ